MRNKRLQHVADNLCQMFCGWRLVNSKRRLEQLGSGNLEIDALTEACTFNGMAIESLSIAGELGAWLKQDLATHHIDAGQLRQAKMTAELSFKRIPKRARVTNDIHFHTGGKVAAPKEFLRCEMACRSRVETDEKVYTGAYHDVEEWPPGWPDGAELNPVIQGGVTLVAPNSRDELRCYAVLSWGLVVLHHETGCRIGSGG